MNRKDSRGITQYWTGPPLNIKTSSDGYHYYVKVVDKVTNNELSSYFIRGGESLNIKVPLGTYEIRYATGKQWYGVSALFGPETSFGNTGSGAACCGKRARPYPARPVGGYISIHR